ncbi:MAG: hypothetical protein IJ877_02825 [Candidatus Gastranaerophilales bacterium]|nr:hypothetical protein [Candidatus Gastranaerophilales bacterium]
MSSENTQNSTGAVVASYLAFPAITGAGEVISVAKRNGGLGASKVAKELEMFNKLNDGLKTANKDVFSRGLTLSDNYEAYKSAAKTAKKAGKYVVETTEGTTVKIPFAEKIKNVFRRLGNKPEVTQEVIQKRAVDAGNNLEEMKGLLNNGKNAAGEIAVKKANEAVQTAQKAVAEATSEEAKQAAQKTLEQATKSAAKTAAKTASQSTLSKVGTLFKEEAKNPLVIFFTALQAIPEIKDNVIPAFKEKGFKAGMKQTGISLLKVGSNFLSMTLGAVLGKVAGGAIGTLICPGAGSAVGAKIGSMLGTTVANVVGDKIVKKAEQKAQESEQKEIQTQQHFDMAM